MTLIALTVNNVSGQGEGFPVMMADILITSRIGDYSMPTPTYLEGAKEIFSTTKDLKPFGLSQKLYVINDHLCVALGGSVAQMTTFLNQLRVIYDTTDFDRDDVVKFAIKFQEEEGTKLDAIILTAKPAEYGHHFQVRGIGSLRQIESELYGNVVAGGSGAAANCFR